MLDFMNYGYGAFGVIALLVLGWAARGAYERHKASAQDRRLNKAAALIAEFEEEAKPGRSAAEAAELKATDRRTRVEQLKARVAAL